MMTTRQQQRRDHPMILYALRCRRGCPSGCSRAVTIRALGCIVVVWFGLAHIRRRLDFGSEKSEMPESTAIPGGYAFRAAFSTSENSETSASFVAPGPHTHA